MTDILGSRAAPVITVLATAERPLRLTEIARLVEAPLSSTQRVVERLHHEGIVIRTDDGRPRYLLAPDIPRDALAEVAGWRLGEQASRQLQQRVASLQQVPTPPGIEERTKAALEDPTHRDRLEAMARRLIWWQSPAETVQDPVRLVLQAMAIGDWDDATFITDLYGDDRLREALAVAPPGVFGPASWEYWHRRLGYARIPPLPERALV